MNLRDLAVMAAVYGSVPFVPFRPFLGLAVYSWIAYMRPHNLSWNLSDARLSLPVGVAILLGIAMAAGRERLVTWRPQTFLLIAFGAWFALTSYTSIAPDRSLYWRDLVLKIVLISVLTTGLVRDRRRFTVLLYVIALSLGLLGAKYGLYGVRFGGAQFADGPGGFMADNNAFALALGVAIPLLTAIVALERRRWLRMLAGVLIGLSALTILFTFSRGGLLTLGVVGILLALHLRRPGLLVGALLTAGAFFFLTPATFQQSYVARAGSIASFEQDPSAMGRLEAWELSWRVFLDHPWVGVGAENFPVAARAYADATYSRVAHSAFFQLLAEGGLPALILFILLLATAVSRLQAVRAASDEVWVRTWARMLQISIIGYVVGSVFLNMAYFDLVYHLVALSVSLEVVAEQGVAEAHQPAEVVPLPWWKQAPAARLKLL